MTTIRYFIPEDGDSELQPNVFLAPKPRHQGMPPTLLQVKDAFPLPGRYHFRFKSPLIPGGDRDKGAMAVWMDCVQDTAPVPSWKGTIVAKVIRTGVEDDEDEEDSEFFSHTPPVAARTAAATPPAARVASPAPAPAPSPAPVPQRQPPSHQNSSELLDDLFDGPSTATPTAAATASRTIPPPHSGGTANFLDGGGHQAQAGKETLLDMSAPVYGSQGSNNNPHSDFLGMTAPAPAPVPTPSPHQTANMHPNGIAQRNPPMATTGGYNPAVNQQAYRQQPMQQKPMQQRPPQAPLSGGNPLAGQQNAFNAFSDQNSPFGGLGTPWKN